MAGRELAPSPHYAPYADLSAREGGEETKSRTWEGDKVKRQMVYRFRASNSTATRRLTLEPFSLC